VTSLDNLRKTAKRWLKALRGGDRAAFERLRRAYPGAPASPSLRDLQHALARERGFDNWTALKASAETPTPRAGLSALLAAADRGDAAAVAAILDKEPEIVNERGLLPGHTGLRTALHFGVHHEAVVRELLSRADPSIRDEGDNAYPIHFAAERGELPIVKLLIEHSADPIGAGTTHLLDVLGWAVCFNNIMQVEVARYLSSMERDTRYCRRSRWATSMPFSRRHATAPISISGWTPRTIVRRRCISPSQEAATNRSPRCWTSVRTRTSRMPQG